jgi:hypothetical protein
MKRTDDTRPEYAKPKIADYGDLREITAKLTSKGLTDVPIGSPGPTNAFSPA